MFLSASSTRSFACSSAGRKLSATWYEIDGFAGDAPSELSPSLERSGPVMSKPCDPA